MQLKESNYDRDIRDETSKGCTCRNGCPISGRTGSYKGIVSKPNIEAGREELEEYLSAKFPVYVALINGEHEFDY